MYKQRDASIQLWLEKGSGHFLPVSSGGSLALQAGWIKPSGTHLGPQTPKSEPISSHKEETEMVSYGFKPPAS